MNNIDCETHIFWENEWVWLPRNPFRS